MLHRRTLVTLFPFYTFDCRTGPELILFGRCHSYQGRLIAVPANPKTSDTQYKFVLIYSTAQIGYACFQNLSQVYIQGPMLLNAMDLPRNPERIQCNIYGRWVCQLVTSLCPHVMIEKFISEPHPSIG